MTFIQKAAFIEVFPDEGSDDIKVDGGSGTAFSSKNPHGIETCTSPEYQSAFGMSMNFTGFIGIDGEVPSRMTFVRLSVGS